MHDDHSPSSEAESVSTVAYTPSFGVANRYDTFWPRFWAGLIDGILFLPLGWLDWWIFSSVSQPLVLAAWFVFSSFAYLLYSVLLHGACGQTVGKMFMRVRVRDVEETTLTYRQAVLRDSVPLVLTVVGVVLGIRVAMSGIDPLADAEWSIGDSLIAYTGLAWFIAEVVTMLWNKKRRALHDFIAGSVVVRG